jgi:hypothetical protein
MNVVAFLIIFTLGSFAGAIGVGTVWAARRVRSHERSGNASRPAPADEAAGDVPPAHRKFIFAVLRDLNTGHVGEATITVDYDDVVHTRPFQVLIVTEAPMRLEHIRVVTPGARTITNQASPEDHYE